MSRVGGECRPVTTLPPFSLESHEIFVGAWLPRTVVDMERPTQLALKAARLAIELAPPVRSHLSKVCRLGPTHESSSLHPLEAKAPRPSATHVLFER